MIILIAYVTVEGHTGDVAARVAEIVEAAGNQAIVVNLADPGFGIPGRFDAVILCAPVHVGHYPARMMSFVANWKHALCEVPSAFVSVSLAIASKNPQERLEAEAYPEQLQQKSVWKPDKVHHAAGALKYVEYDFFKRWIMRRIARSEGGPVDTTRDYVLTDWNALEKFIRDFLRFSAR
jgi:menaquinone-dependent protoporphyrinogen oxidase